MAVKVTTALTPVESRHGRWYKREDYHRLGPVNGAKLRACQALIGGMASRGVQGQRVTPPRACGSSALRFNSPSGSGYSGHRDCESDLPRRPAGLR